MTEHNLNHVSQISADNKKDETGDQNKRVDWEILDKIVIGINSGDFKQAIKAYAMFDRISKKLPWEYKRV